MPRQLGPHTPGPKCLGIWDRVIICTSRHLGPGRGAEGPDAFYLLAPAGFDTIDTFVFNFSTVSYSVRQPLHFVTATRLAICLSLPKSKVTADLFDRLSLVLTRSTARAILTRSLP